MKILLLSVSLVAVAIALLCVKIFAGGKFPSGHVHDLEGLRQKGIDCALHQTPDSEIKH